MNNQKDYLFKPAEEICQFTTQLLGIFTPKYIKGLRTKRRRIRSYFGGQNNINSIDLTIGSDKTAEGIIGGFFLKINARVSLKALKNASEGYCLDQTYVHILSPVFYSLVYIFCLHLSHIPITLYITSHEVLELCYKLKTKGSDSDDSFEKCVGLMFHYLNKVDLMPCVKGPFFDRMEAKLDQIKYEKTNELVILDYELINNLFAK